MRTTDTRSLIAHAERGEWLEARSIVEGWLAGSNAGIFNPPDGPPAPPSTPFSPAKNAWDALNHANQKHAVYTTHHPIHGSNDRSAYRRALHNLWNVISYYEQDQTDA